MCAFVHFLPVSSIKSCRPVDGPVLPQAVGANICIFIPQFHVFRELVEQFCTLAVPFRMLLPRKDLLGHVAGTNNSARHNARNLLPRTGQTENIACQHPDTLSGLLQRTGRFAGLRVVHDHKTRSDRASVRLFILHPAYTTGDARHADNSAACHAASDRRKNNLVTGPRDPGALALVELTVTSVCNSLKRVDREHHLREILRQRFIDFQFGFDRIQHFQRCRFCRSYQHYKLFVSIEKRPESSNFCEGRFTGTARHGQRKQSATKNRLLNFLNRFQVIRGPAQMEHLLEI